MGGCSSTPATKDGSAKTTTNNNKSAAGSKKPAAPVKGQKPETHPDFGLKETHDVIKFLGRGGTGDTYLFKDKQNGEEVAVKLIKRPIPKVIMPNILREIRIQAELGEGHMNVINAKEVLLTQTHLALVMEFAAGASLTSYVAEKWQAAQHTGLFLTEDEARYFFKQFVGAVEYCHAHCVAHRDLKLDNTLLDDSDPPMIKLCDFGFAKTWAGDDANMMTHIGTPVYMSPELIHSRNGAKGYDGKLVDVWASGVLLIVMLLGTFPFDHLEHPDPNTTEAHLEVWLQQVKQKWSEIPHISKQVEKAHLSPECVDLLNRIFVIDEKERISLAEIKAHPWYNKPLLAKHTHAEKQIAIQQAEIQRYIQTRKIDEKKLQARSDELARMIEAAAQRPQPGVQEPLIRINLRESAVTDQITSAGVGQLGSISEAGAPVAAAPMAGQAPMAANGVMAGQMHPGMQPQVHA